MFVAAAFAAANGDLPVVRRAPRSASRPTPPPRPGSNYYLKQLQQNPDYWTKCDAAPTPRTRPSRTRSTSSGTAPGPTRALAQDPGRHRPSTRSSCCTPPRYTDVRARRDQAGLAGRHVQRARSRSASPAARPTDRRRQALASSSTFRRDGFLNFVYFTDYENRDPQAAVQRDRAHRRSRPTAPTSTARRARTRAAPRSSSRPATRSTARCTPTTRACWSAARRPSARENQDGSAATKTDAVEVSGAAPGYVASPAAARATRPRSTRRPSKFTTSSKHAARCREQRGSSQTVAEAAAAVYTGKTIIRLKTRDDGRHQLQRGRRRPPRRAWPGNGVLYVKNNGACNGEIPTDADYDEPIGCGNVYVSGTYSKSLTIAAANDVIIRPTLGAKRPAGRREHHAGDGSDATLGLIANNFVRVGHRVDRQLACAQLRHGRRAVVTNVHDRRRDPVAAALVHRRQLRLRPARHADRQRRDRAEVPRPGRHRHRRHASPPGYLKDYWYDDRLRYRSPPYFLEPGRRRLGRRALARAGRRRAERARR